MAADGEPPPWEGNGDVCGGGTGNYLQEFELYETRSNFYMIGVDKKGGRRRVLKIGRLEGSELSLCEDGTTYSKEECQGLLKNIHEENRSTGGLKFVTNCYGIVGFARYLGPYYMLLITKRRPIGTICGHTVYAISESQVITVSGFGSLRSELDFRNESRYKKLLCMVDLKKDFFFSYSFHVMRSLQKNFSDIQTGEVVYESMFVWNEYLTREVRCHLKNTIWTVALVHGFFKQKNVKLKATGKEFKLTLIARRSRHYAGTRFLKRGVNEEGNVANDVETEQIVFEDVLGVHPSQISSVVQYRGSIPLVWSQEASKLNLKPDILLQENNQNYEATKLHFENLVERYGNPIIILNLIKTHEKIPRESKLWVEFVNAIESINQHLSGEDYLRFLHWDLSMYSKREAASALAFLEKVATCALESTGFFYCQFMQNGTQKSENDMDQHINWNNNMTDPLIISIQNTDTEGDNAKLCYNNLMKFSMLQRGVLRTNCIDCLDRTNVAQYAYGLAALGHQLHMLGLIDESKIDLDEPLADELMYFYETMGDTLALQYTGSAAHNKIFSERRGQWKAAIQSQEFLRTLQRYYSNVYMDATKQAAINVFLGQCHSQKGEPSIWEPCSVMAAMRRVNGFADENSGTFVKRSLSDGNILCQCMIESGIKQKRVNSELLNTAQQGGEYNSLSSSPYCDNTILLSRKLTINREKKCSSSEHSAQHVHERTSSNFLDLGLLSPSEKCSQEETYESSHVQESTGNRTEDSSEEIVPLDTTSANMVPCDGFGNMSQKFSQWVISGGTFYH